jgi:hypothetical protein
MIENFEYITIELTDDEKKLIQPMIAGFKKRTAENPIKAPDIVKAINISFYDTGVLKNKFSEVKLRKIANYIRSYSLLPLIATSKGYYTSYNPEDIESQIRSLGQRVSSIQSCMNGLRKIKNSNNQ